MKKILVLFFAAGCLFVSCNPTDDSDSKTEKKTSKKEISEEEETEEEGPDARKIATAFCGCFNNSSMSDINPRMKKIITKASNSDDPAYTLQAELMKIEDEEERNKLGEDFQAYADNGEMDACTKKIKKKYNLDENDKKLQRKIITELEENDDCSFLAALMRMGMKMESQKETSSSE